MKRASHLAATASSAREIRSVFLADQAKQKQLEELKQQLSAKGAELEEERNGRAVEAGGESSGGRAVWRKGSLMLERRRKKKPVKRASSPVAAVTRKTRGIELFPDAVAGRSVASAADSNPGHEAEDIEACCSPG